MKPIWAYSADMGTLRERHDTPVTEHAPQGYREIDHSDYRDICSFCAEIYQVAENNLLLELMPDNEPGDFVLHETEHFTVVPAVGSVCDGYVVIVPKQHVLSFGHLDRALDTELTDLFTRLTDYLHKGYGHPAFAFEHGAESFRNRGGSCTDHAHMHVFPSPVSLDLAAALRDGFEPHRVAGLLPDVVQQITRRRKPYLWVRNADSSMWLCDAPHALSQFIRRYLVTQLGREDEWDWAVFPGIPHIRQTIQHFRDVPFP